MSEKYFKPVVQPLLDKFGQEITPAEFYEKYWVIKTKNGTVYPPKLSEKEAEFLNKAFEQNAAGVLYSRRRRRPVSINLEYLKEAIEKYKASLKTK